MGLLRYFLMLDSFGVGINFYLKGYKDYHSHLGGFVTALIYVATIICGLYFSKELFQKSNPSVSTSTANYPNPKKINYPDSTFFILGVTVDSLPFIDNSIYRPIGYINRKINGTEQPEIKNISVETCNKVFNKDYKFYNEIGHLNLSNFYCISLNQNTIDLDELYVNEFWGNEGFQMLQIKLYNCNAIAENKNECASDDIMKEKLKSPIISYYTLRNFIDTNNYKQPFVRGLHETFYYVSYKKYVSATQYLKHMQIHSDNGLLFSEEEIIEDNTVDSMIEYSEPEQEDGKIFTMTIQLTNKIEIYSRSYFKLQDLGAEIGAIYGVLHMVFEVIFNFYNNSKLFSNIINKFFLIKEDFTPLNRQKKSFINLKKKFRNDLNLVISLQKTSFITSHNNILNKSFNKQNNLSNISNISDINRHNKTTEENIRTTEPFNNREEKNNGNDFTQRILNLKKKEDEKKIKIDFTYVDRFICLYLISLCRHKVNPYSYYNLFYKGKDYIISALDITNYLKYNHFLQMVFLINGKETKDLYEYVTTPILSSNYVGPRFQVEK